MFYRSLGASLNTAAIVIGGLLAFSPALSHHSLVGEFDTSVDFELRGTITELEWFNPHIWFYMDVVNADGETEKW
ncbi:MAG: DUF6152 family protein, partial [Pseudohongiellaceae bacterium]